MPQDVPYSIYQGTFHVPRNIPHPSGMGCFLELGFMKVLMKLIHRVWIITTAKTAAAKKL